MHRIALDHMHLQVMEVSRNCDNARWLGILMLELKQCCCPKQKINQVAMIKSVVIVEVMGNIHTDYNFLKEISCEF